MTGELLNAECVIEHLNNNNIITMSDWQNRHPADQNYTVYFTNPSNLTADVGIYIIKRSGKYNEILKAQIWYLKNDSDNPRLILLDEMLSIFNLYHFRMADCVIQYRSLLTPCAAPL